MSTDDDLGSFFAEINQIETTHEDDEYQGSVTGKRKFEDTIVAPPVVVAASGPQLTKTNHPTSTYSSLIADTSSSLLWNHSEQTNISNDPNASVAYSSSSLSSLLPQNNQTSSVSSFNARSKLYVRTGAGETWVDESLSEWPDNDYRIFVGDLGKEVNSDMLTKAFQHYKSFAKAKVVKSKVENKGRGYGFVSFLDPMDCARAIREMNDKYLGTRPMKIRKSNWKDRNIEEVKEKEKKRKKLKESLGLAS